MKVFVSARRDAKSYRRNNMFWPFLKDFTLDAHKLLKSKFNIFKTKDNIK